MLKEALVIASLTFGAGINNCQTKQGTETLKTEPEVIVVPQGTILHMQDQTIIIQTITRIGDSIFLVPFPEYPNRENSQKTIIEDKIGLIPNERKIKEPSRIVIKTKHH